MSRVTSPGRWASTRSRSSRGSRAGATASPSSRSATSIVSAALESSIEASTPSLAVAGAMMRGVGIPACIRQGRARRVGSRVDERAARRVVGSCRSGASPAGDEPDVSTTGLASLRERPWPRRGLSLARRAPDRGVDATVRLVAGRDGRHRPVGLAHRPTALDATVLDRRDRRASPGSSRPRCGWSSSASPDGRSASPLWFGFVGGVTAAICPPGRWRFVALAGALILSEWLRWHAPFGGVPLSMLAMTQGRGPLLPVARVVGSIGVSAAVAVLGCALRRAVRSALARRSDRHGGGGRRRSDRRVRTEGPRHADIEVAAVQGGGPQQTRSADTDYAVVFGRHMDASDRITATGRSRGVARERGERARFQGLTGGRRSSSALAQRLHATVVAGVVEDAGPNHFLNAAVAIGPDGTQIDRYDKVRRVPYGEYVPLRFLLDPIVGSELPPRDQVPGHDPNILTTPAGRLGHGDQLGGVLPASGPGRDARRRRPRHQPDERIELLAERGADPATGVVVVAGGRVGSLAGAGRAHGLQRGRRIRRATSWPVPTSAGPPCSGTGSSYGRDRRSPRRSVTCPRCWSHSRRSEWPGRPRGVAVAPR